MDTKIATAHNAAEVNAIIASTTNQYIHLVFAPRSNADAMRQDVLVLVIDRTRGPFLCRRSPCVVESHVVAVDVETTEWSVRGEFAGVLRSAWKMAGDMARYGEFATA